MGRRFGLEEGKIFAWKCKQNKGEFKEINSRIVQLKEIINLRNPINVATIKDEQMKLTSNKRESFTIENVLTQPKTLTFNEKPAEKNPTRKSKFTFGSLYTSKQNNHPVKKSNKKDMEKYMGDEVSLKNMEPMKRRSK